LEKDRELNDITIEILQQQQLLKDQEIKIQKIIIYSMGAGLVLVLLSFLLIFKSLRQRKVANQRLALKSLRSQMNPHFIFNSLNSVNHYIAQSDERAANKYLSEFAQLIRMVMENSKHEFIALSEEVTFLKLYLSLEHLRFKEKFDYSLEVDDKISVEDYIIPPMIIQPYIENAVWHGLRYKEEKGHLYVKMMQLVDGIKITIEDDGIGRKKSKALKTRNQQLTQSTGMKNISHRLQIIREINKLNIQVQIDDLNVGDKTGTRVVVLIPSHKNKNE